MKRFKRGNKGFTLVELLIVVAILGILAAVVIPNVVGLMGRGGTQAYETDQEVIQLAAATFYSDVHSGFSGGTDAPTISTFDDNMWGANTTAQDAGHYYPTAIGVVGSHFVQEGTPSAAVENNNPQLVQADGTTAATDQNVKDHAMWMGLLTNTPGSSVANDATGLADRGTTSVLAVETGLYLQELPESASHGESALGLNDEANGAGSPGGGYTWVVGENGTVFGVYSIGPNLWYVGFSGAYP